MELRLTISARITSYNVCYTKLLRGNVVDYRSCNEVKASDGQLIELMVIAPDGVTTSTYSFTIHLV